MTSWQATSEDRPTGSDGAFRAIGLAAVCIGIAVLAAATFVLSYQGIRAVALQAGIEPRYARGYPLLIDAMLVIVLAAVLALRGAGLPSRVLAWLTLLIVLCAAAGADTLHATGRKLPHNAAVVTAAVLPWALVFVAFVLLLAILRHARLHRQASVVVAQESWLPPTGDGQENSQQSQPATAPRLPVRSPQPWHSVSIVPGFTSQLVSSAVAGAAAGAAVADVEPVSAPDESPVLLEDTDQEATAVAAAEPVAPTATRAGSDEAETPDGMVSSGEVEAYVPVPAEEPTVQPDDGDSQADAPEPQTGSADPQTDHAEPLMDREEPVANETYVQTGEPQTDEADLQTGEPHPPTDYAGQQTDYADPQTDYADPQTDYADPQTDYADPVANKAQAQPGDDPVTDEPHPPTDHADPQTDHADSQVGEDDPVTDEAQAQPGDDDPVADEAQAQSGDDDMPVFRRIRTSPTPPEE